MPFSCPTDRPASGPLAHPPYPQPSLCFTSPRLACHGARWRRSAKLRPFPAAHRGRVARGWLVASLLRPTQPPGPRLFPRKPRDSDWPHARSLLARCIFAKRHRNAPRLSARSLVGKGRRLACALYFCDKRTPTLSTKYLSWSGCLVTSRGTGPYSLSQAGACLRY